jgi:phosphoglycolate phosphatase
LVLWDVDHTLLAVRNISRAAYAAGFERATGVRFTHQPAMAGRTDRAIIQDALRHHALPLNLVDQVASAIGAEYTARSGQVHGNGRVLAGAMAALVELNRVPDVHQSVLTGNMRPIADVKLTALGLAEHLDMEIGA